MSISIFEEQSKGSIFQITSILQIKYMKVWEIYVLILIISF